MQACVGRSLRRQQTSQYWASAWAYRRLQLRTARQCSMRHTLGMVTCQACSTAATRCFVACHQVGAPIGAEHIDCKAGDRAAFGSRLDRHTQHADCSDSAAGPDFAVVRYHSLAVDEATLPACLEAVAWARGVQPSRGGVNGSASGAAGHALEDPVLMGLVHRHRPHYAVQVCAPPARFTVAVQGWPHCLAVPWTMWL